MGRRFQLTIQLGVLVSNVHPNELQYRMPDNIPVLR